MLVSPPAHANRTLHHVLLDLERRLLLPEVRRDPHLAEALLVEEFQEFGKSGRVYSRSDILKWMAAEQAEDKPMATLENYKVALLGPEAALATYISIAADGSRANRSSTWVYRAGRWQMLFHQGTPIA